ncbi:type II and III secretion system protein [Pedosphaera parvula]|uniref:Type II and III secretion system protein n=1 Tax=Pedosphaera parvula (strain Ellin514) TaxID=320771 RepID=B9XF01_PEDPL|nr:type II and III secretion system protein [Pedosphaera parvula]EEF61499.1 type II and III secretion system protein [Pedosphaera parvula Ellin514]
MIKAALRLFGLVFLLVAAISVRAQTVSPDASTAASEEAVRRAADTRSLRQDLVLAQSAQQRKDYVQAARLYEHCYTLVQRIGPAAQIQAETRQVVIGLSAVLLELAHQAQAHGDYVTADERIKRVLIIDPHNQVALQMAQDNKRLIALQAGKVPSAEVLAELPGIHTNEIRVATLVQDGKVLFEAGKLDAAEAKLEQAYKEDPQSVGAYYYLNLIKEKRNGQAVRRSELESKDAILQVEKQWDVSLQKQQLQLPNSFARSTAVYTSKGRQAIQSKLDRIRVDSIKYDGLPLAEVINNLSEIAKTRDPDRTGINFFINREAPAGATQLAAPGGIDQTTGLPTAAAALPTEPVDVGGVTVKIAPALTDVRLADVLDAITKTSDKPIKYSIEDYAVVFSLKGPETVPLFTRTYRVDPNTFRQGLESVGGIAFGNITTGSSGSGGGGGGGGGQGGQGSVDTIVPRVNVAAGAVSGGQQGGGGQTGANGIRNVTKTNAYEEVQIAVRNFFTAAGVDFNPVNPANVGKSLFFNDRKGILMVHASSQDLDIIEKAIQTLNVAPPQINIKAKFIEITQNDSKALGFDWFLGNFLLGGGKLGAQGGTAPSFAGAPSTANPSGVFPGSPATIDPVTGLGSLPTTIPPSTSDQLITGGLRNTAGTATVPTIATVTGLLTDPQFRVAIRALEQRDGVDLLTAPDVTTESGRQAQIQAIDIQTIVTGQQFGQGANGANAASGVGSTVIQNTATTSQYTTQTLPFGPVLDVIPYVSADEFSVQMTIIPTVTEFVQYDPPGPFVPQASAIAGGTSVVGALPLPHFRMRQVTTSVTVWDSQTVVLGGLITDSVTKIKDQVPLLGDMPFVGRLFRSESSQKTKKNLVIFVTPTIINPDGSRYHSDDEMPFAANSFPPQKPITQ